MDRKADYMKTEGHHQFSHVFPAGLGKVNGGLIPIPWGVGPRSLGIIWGARTDPRAEVRGERVREKMKYRCWTPQLPFGSPSYNHWVSPRTHFLWFLPSSTVSLPVRKSWVKTESHQIKGPGKSGLFPEGQPRWRHTWKCLATSQSYKELWGAQTSVSCAPAKPHSDSESCLLWPSPLTFPWLLILIHIFMNFPSTHALFGWFIQGYVWKLRKWKIPPWFSS